MLNPLLDVIDQHVPIAWRSARRQQQRMVAARIGTGNGPRGKPAATVCLQPFEAQRAIEILTIFLSQFSSSSTSRVARIERFLTARMFHDDAPPVQLADSSNRSCVRVVRAKKLLSPCRPHVPILPTAGSTSRPVPSIPSDGSPRSPLRYRHGSTRKKEWRLARKDPPGISSSLHRPDVGRFCRGEKYASVVARSPKRPRSRRRIDLIVPGTRPCTHHRENNGTSGAIRSADS